MKCYVAIAGAVLLSTATFAQSQNPPSQSPPSPSSIFEALDTDRSGGINQTEAQAHPVVAKSFAQADANADGTITSDEFSAAYTTSPSQNPPRPQSSTVPPQ